MSSVNDITKAIGFRVFSVTSGEAVGIQTTFNNVHGTKLTFTVIGGDVRYRYDGEAEPTSNTGHYIGNGLQAVLYGAENLDQLRLIAVSTTATVTTTVEAPA